MRIKATIHAATTSLLLCMSICYAQAQADPLLGKFSLSESNGQVAISWQIVAGTTCNGIQIYRSTDTINFSRIGYIPGICGSESEAVNYSFTDTTPVLNAINYYYLELGGVGSTQVIAIEIINNGHARYQIRPHPVQNTGRIYFDAQNGKDYFLHIYNLLGKEVFWTKTSDDHFDITTSALAPGPYVFTISDDGRAVRITGKLMVQ